jgi:Uma2 family endonuclease
MSALPSFKLPVSEAEYLAGEEASEIQHEFLNGLVRAMATPTKRHNLLLGNFRVAIDGPLRRKGCRAYTEKVSVRIPVATGVFFYYPDILVHCGPDNSDIRYTDDASLIIEVLSDSTEHTDRAEKLFMYQQLPSFAEYVLVGQDEPDIMVLRKTGGWKPQSFRSLDQTFRLETLDCEIRMADIYSV